MFRVRIELADQVIGVGVVSNVVEVNPDERIIGREDVANPVYADSPVCRLVER